MKKIYILALMNLLLVGVHAQKRYTPSLSAGIQVAQPLNQFAEQFDGYPAGFNATFVAPLGNSPLYIGASAAWNSMGNQQEQVPVFIGTDADGDEIFEQGQMDIRSNHNRFHVVGRFSPLRGPVQLYVDGIAGLGTFATKTQINLDSGTYTEQTGTKRHHWDASLNAGWAAGIKVEVFDHFYIEGRFESLRGGRATFVDPETISVVNESEIGYKTKESVTDVYTYTLGLSIQF